MTRLRPQKPEFMPLALRSIEFPTPTNHAKAAPLPDLNTHFDSRHSIFIRIHYIFRPAGTPFAEPSDESNFIVLFHSIL